MRLSKWITDDDGDDNDDDDDDDDDDKYKIVSQKKNVVSNFLR